MDWITFVVESIGIVILCVWIVLPIREFAAIARRMLQARKHLERSEEHFAETHP